MRVDPLASMPEPTAEAVKAARLEAGLTQAQAAELLGLGHVMRWSEYERGVYGMDVARFALFLLATGQHPTLKLSRRRTPTLPL